MHTQRTDWARVRRIAYAVRDWSERHARRARGMDFHRSDDLTGMCAYASTVLLACLQRMGVEDAVLVANDEHAHLRIGSKIIDITATQFRSSDDIQPRVEISTLPRMKARYARDPEAWNAKEIYRTPDDVFEALNPAAEKGFCEGQYWRTRSAMMRTIEQALQFCAGRGLVQADRSDEQKAILAVRKAA